MNNILRVGNFEKVSFAQFFEAMRNEFNDLTNDDIKEIYDNIQIPVRATARSAGYDFKSPISFCLRPGETIKIPTGIWAKIQGDWFLACLPRSGLGFKYRLQLDNTIGVIDADYSDSDNEGHIFIKITNDSKTNKTLSVKAGDGFVQAIFIPFGITYSDNASAARNGGMGSTGR